MNDVINLEWKCVAWEDLDTDVLYRILKLRSEVFVVEQNCVYLDLDDKDREAKHLIGLNHKSDIVAYSRLFHSGIVSSAASIGRVLVHPKYRKQQCGHLLMQQSIHHLALMREDQEIVISAQCYLIDFYRQHGFEIVGEPYEEDGIPHIKMVRNKEKGLS